MATTFGMHDFTRALVRAETVVLTGPLDLDGDAVGAIAALDLAIRVRWPGKRVRVVADEQLPDRYGFLDPAGRFERACDVPVRPVDMAIVLDGDPGRLGAAAAHYEAAGVRAQVDHHKTSDPAHVDVAVLDPLAASTTELVLGLCDHWGVPLEPRLATAIYAGLVFDTHVFRYRLTRPPTLRAAARLMEVGIDHASIVERVLLDQTLGKQRLRGRMLDRMQVDLGGRLVWAVLHRDEIEGVETGGLVDDLIFIEGVECGALLVEREHRDDIANGYSGQPNPAWDSLPADRREDLARRMAAFAAMVERMDLGVGRILEDIEKHGELSNTLIVFLSDNGACYEWGPFGFDKVSRDGVNILHRGAGLDQMGQNGSHSSYGSAWANLGNTPFRFYKHFCHEGGIADPLIVRWPDGVARRGIWSHDPTHVMDIVPTVLDAAGLAYPARRGGEDITPVEGVSLAPTFAGKALPERVLAFEHQEARGLRKGDWKIAWGKRMTNEPSWELYNLKTDRVERRNLAQDQPERVRELADAWMQWAKRVKVHPFFDGAGTNAAAQASIPDDPNYGVVDVLRPALQIPVGTKPLLDVWMRDTWVTRGPDGSYYLTGTTATPRRRFDTNGPQCWDWNDGLYLWRSGDLKKWKALGCVWSLDKAKTWQSAFATARTERHSTGYKLDPRRRAVWAPELHYIRSATNWFLVACMSDASPRKGSFILRSKSGRPEGPYENIPGNVTGPIFPNIDGSLFEDDDGGVWFVGHSHQYARMKPDMSGFDGGLRLFDETPYRPEPYIEGAFVFKRAGRYHLTQAIWSFKMPDGAFTYQAGAEKRGGVRWSYDCVIASAPALGGPYGPRSTAGVGIGHNNLFQDRAGEWWATCFGNPRGVREFQQAFLCRPAIVPMLWENGRARPDPSRTPR